MKITIEFCIFESVFVPDFSLNQQFCIFGPNLPKNGISSLYITEKVNTTTEFSILELVFVLNFSLLKLF